MFSHPFTANRLTPFTNPLAHPLLSRFPPPPPLVQIILMLADDAACDPRNPMRNQVCGPCAVCAVCAVCARCYVNRVRCVPRRAACVLSVCCLCVVTMVCDYGAPVCLYAVCAVLCARVCAC